MKLEMQNITKTFGSVTALSNVSFVLEEGSIHGLLGENGAGKTTLMNVLAGSFPPDEGRIFLDGEEVKELTPSKTMALGIRFIHQELNLCNHLRVYQNMFLGVEETSKGLVKKNEEIKRSQEVLNRMLTTIKATDVVSSLTTAEKQLVEIARALLFESKIIIMDEPTTALNNEEIKTLFTLMKELQKEGVSFIYISHKMPEIFEVCTDYTVLRDGKFVDSGKIRDIDERRATELLIGKTFISENAHSLSNRSVGNETTLTVSSLSGETFSDISFTLKRGEVLAITGLQGSGVEELSMSLFGASKRNGGEIETESGEFLGKNEREAIKRGIAMIPRNRKERGILSHLSIRNNNSIAYFTAKHKKLIVNKKEEEERFLSSQEKLSIKVSSSQDPITSLSGGNQQKVIISRWLEVDSPVFIMDNPTQGIDVGAKFEIYKLINSLAEEGKSIIVFSNEFPEISQVADRVIVLYKGRINGELKGEEMTEYNMMALSVGGKINENA